MEKNLNTQASNINLLGNKEFRSYLQFESEYSAVVKGGHFPYYYNEQKAERLVSDVNLLTSLEQAELINQYLTGKN
jgi:hypothetical protein